MIELTDSFFDDCKVILDKDIDIESISEFPAPKRHTMIKLKNGGFYCVKERATVVRDKFIN